MGAIDPQAATKAAAEMAQSSEIRLSDMSVLQKSLYK
jgi:hypothetical protein